jgi:hypothetical protein
MHTAGAQRMYSHTHTRARLDACVHQPVKQVPANEQFVVRKHRAPQDDDREMMTANKLGSYRVHGVTDDRSVRVYCMRHPLPSATTTASLLLGSPGGLVRGWCSDYKVSPLEVARAHGFTKEALDQVGGTAYEH